MKTVTYSTMRRAFTTLAMLTTLGFSFGVSNAQADVYINGHHIPPAILKAHVARSGIPIPDGHYWVDARSGKWGKGDRPPYQAKATQPTAKPQYRYTEDSMANSIAASGYKIPRSLVTNPIY